MTSFIVERALDYTISALVALAMGGFTLLVRSYFDRIHRDMLSLEGKVDLLSKQLGEHTTKLALVQQELKALWRFADGAFGRASDRRRTPDDPDYPS
jgi:hypothetical protein